MARSGMQTLIDTVRGYANAATDEWTSETDSSLVEYWSDAEIERVLDRHKTEVFREPLERLTARRYATGTTNIEGGSAFEVEDGNGAAVAGFTVDLARGVVSFAADQSDSIRLFWSGYAYDLYAAAADIWRMKAAHVANLVDFSTDGHSIKRSQQAVQYLSMALHYQQRSGDSLMTAKIVRDDLP